MNIYWGNKEILYIRINAFLLYNSFTLLVALEASEV